MNFSETIKLGTTPGDGKGDGLRTNLTKLLANDNFLKDLANLLRIDVDNLKLKDVDGIIRVDLLSDRPAVGDITKSYYVTQEAVAADNGFYHWTGSVYVKDSPTALSNSLQAIANLQKYTIIMKNGSAAFARAEMLYPDKVVKLTELDKVINDNPKAAFLWKAGFISGVGRLGALKPNIAAADMGFVRPTTLDYVDINGNPQTAAINEVVFDWSTGEPLLNLNGNTSGVKTGDLSAKIDSKAFVFEVDMSASSDDVLVNEYASLSDGTWDNLVAPHYNPDSDALNIAAFSNATTFGISNIFIGDISELINVKSKVQEGMLEVLVNEVFVGSREMTTEFADDSMKFAAMQGPTGFEKSKGFFKTLGVKNVIDFRKPITDINQIASITKTTRR